jgi:hypothetical protein
MARRSFLILEILVLLAVLVTAYFLNRQFTPGRPTNVAMLTGDPSTASGEFVVNPKIEFYCGFTGRVRDAVIILDIAGGKPPYHVQFPDEPVLDMTGTGITFTLPAGSSLNVTLYDSEEERNEQEVELLIPKRNSQCQGSATSTAAPSTATLVIATHTDTATPTSTNTPHRTWTPTSTEKERDPTATRIPTGTPTVPATPTPTENATGTPTPISTPTPTDRPGATPTQNPTGTPVDAPTPTPVQNPTSTPGDAPPTPTSADSHLKQCADGRDNDGDGKTDLDDPECQNPNDNNESN